MIERKSTREIAKQAQAGMIVAETLAAAGRRGRAGRHTAELDRIAERHIKRRGGVPTFKGYRGFPGSICSSPNDMIVHGIPGAYVLADGDILSVDVGVTYRGFVGDSAVTVPVGEVAAETMRLLAVCQEALRRMIEQCEVGNRLLDLGHACQTYVEGEGLRRRPAAGRPRRRPRGCTRIRRSRTSARPAAARSCRRAWCSRSSR